MVSNEDNWVRIFDIPDTSKHKKGFTIYKVISMLYPRNCPDSITKVTVWKRYNEFKKLHRDVKAQHKLLKIKDRFPSLPGTSYFRRFDEDVIQQRRANILKFLEFVAAHPELFTSDVCVTFFKTSYTPCELLNSNIHSIRADLNLPVESDYDLIRTNSDDERTISDTDSISTLSSTMEHLPDPLSQSTPAVKLSKKLIDISLTNSCTSSHDSLNISAANVSLDSSTILEGQVFLTPPETPNSMNMASPTYYILEASQYITRAVEFEVDKKYQEAFTAYKAGIDVLLRNVRDDKDFDRKEMIRYKIEKYLLRAEKIYHIHLSPESKTIQNYAMENEDQTNETVQQSVSDLYKYKVVKVIASGMLVLHSDSQQLFYIKVIHKNSKFSNDKLVLPGNVPYMIKLYNYYNCENALFLVLQYCSGAKFSDYIKQRQTNPDDFLNMSFCSNATSFINADYNKEDDGSDYDSDHSYSDLIQDYTSHKLERLNSTTRSENFDVANEEKVEVEERTNFQEDTESSESKSEEKLTDGSSEVGDLLLKSQELITSVDSTLNTNWKLENNYFQPQINEVEKVYNSKSIKSSRKSSERSDWSLFDDCQFTENTLLPLHDITKWAAQLLLALERLHLLGVICCNLQTKNILIDECGDLVLTYMCNVTEKYDVAFNNTSDLTLAPEMYSFQPITEAVDWWSYGAILYELLVGMPLKAVHPEELTTYTILKIPRYVAVEGRSLLKQLLAYEVHERLGNGINGAEDIKSHPFFSSVVWDDVASKWRS